MCAGQRLCLFVFTLQPPLFKNLRCSHACSPAPSSLSSAYPGCYVSSHIVLIGDHLRSYTASMDAANDEQQGAGGKAPRESLRKRQQQQRQQQQQRPGGGFFALLRSPLQAAVHTVRVYPMLKASAAATQAALRCDPLRPIHAHAPTCR